MVETAVLSIASYAVWGAIGAVVALFAFTWAGGNWLETGRKPTTLLAYVLVGGVVAVVVNVGSNPEFTLAQIPLAFAAGFGWPAVLENRKMQKEQKAELAAKAGELDQKDKTVTHYRQKLEQVERSNRTNLLAGEEGGSP